MAREGFHQGSPSPGSTTGGDYKTHCHARHSNPPNVAPLCSSFSAAQINCPCFFFPAPFPFSFLSVCTCTGKPLHTRRARACRCISARPRVGTKCRWRTQALHPRSERVRQTPETHRTCLAQISPREGARIMLSTLTSVCFDPTALN